ncbi:MAG: nuclear transport factor 2 family protein [Bacteroidota bacterium]|nr:nuclear transport factor 2 family protein [Bacteroidota bacterium]
MKKTIFILLTTLVIAFSCKEERKTDKKSNKKSANNYSATVIVEDNSTPSVDISKYTLVSNQQKERRNHAKEILKVKRKWPLAMQSLNPLEFDSILSKNFTFKGSDKFFNRADYIKNRTTPDEWKITSVKYDNVTLQFFGDTGVLSYLNHITNKNVNTAAIEYEHISWVDIYVIEDGKWKIEAAHAIDYRLELPEQK